MDTPQTKKQQHKGAKEKRHGKSGPGFSTKHVRAIEALQEQRAASTKAK
jgi:hypothetical protein